MFCWFTKMKQEWNENACNLFLYIVNLMSELVGDCIQRMLAKSVLFALKRIYKISHTVF